MYSYRKKVSLGFRVLEASLDFQSRPKVPDLAMVEAENSQSEEGSS